MSVIKTIIFIVSLLSTLFIMGCDMKKDPTQEKSENKNELKEKFNHWKAEQDPKLVDDYFQFIRQYLTQPPTKLEIMTNRNVMVKACESERFAIPPKAYWNNVVGSLKLLDQLYRDAYFERYTITAMYRSPSLNTCVHGAKQSKHVYHYAVDFHVLDPKETHEQDRKLLVKALCQFWQAEGKKLKMGLGMYGNNRFHIDTQGYRTWGKDFKSKSSPCLNASVN